MNTEMSIKKLNDELRATKIAYEQYAYNLIVYEYDLDIDTSYIFIDKTVIAETVDGSNTLAFIDGANYVRMPYEGGAKFYLYNSQGSSGVVKLYSMQKVEVTVSD